MITSSGTTSLEKAKVAALADLANLDSQANDVKSSLAKLHREYHHGLADVLKTTDLRKAREFVLPNETNSLNNP